MTNRVLFLGAGFSIALANTCIINNQKYPSLRDLTSKILNDFSKTSLETHLNEISSKYRNDIEQLLTYLSVELPWQNPQMRYLNKALYFEIINKISKYFNKLEEECEYTFDKFQNFSEYIINNKIPIITLNYDILLEKFLFSTMSEKYKRRNTYKGFYKQAIVDLYSRVPYYSFGLASGEDDNNGEKLPSIYKLHGSINWLWSATNPSEPIYLTSGKEHRNLRKDLSEYIIPPVLDKTQFYNHNILRSIWADAYNVLHKADELYIIGFSFPVTDISVRFLFNSAFSDRHYPKVYVINTKEALKASSSEYIKERYNQIFPEENIDYTFCCEDSLNKFIERL